MTRNITQEIDDWITNEGKGDMWDALNVALARLESAEAHIKILQDEIKDLQNQLYRLGVDAK